VNDSVVGFTIKEVYITVKSECWFVMTSIALFTWRPT